MIMTVYDKVLFCIICLRDTMLFDYTYICLTLIIWTTLFLICFHMLRAYLWLSFELRVDK